MSYFNYLIPYIIFSLFYTYTFFTFILTTILINSYIAIDNHINNKINDDNLIYKCFQIKNNVISQIKTKYNNSGVNLLDYVCCYSVYTFCTNLFNSIDEVIVLLLSSFYNKIMTKVGHIVMQQNNQPMNTTEIMALFQTSVTKLEKNHNVLKNKIYQKEQESLLYDSDDVSEIHMDLHID